MDKSERKKEYLDLEKGILNRISYAVLGVIGLSAATNLFWLISGLANKSFTPIDDWYLNIMLAALIACCVALGIFSGYQISKKRVAALRYTILIFDTLVIAETCFLFVYHNRLFPSAGMNAFFDIPLSSLLLLIPTFLPLVRYGDSIYVMLLSLASVLAPCFLPGRETYQILPQLILFICILFAYTAFRQLSVSHMQNVRKTEAQQKQQLRLTIESLETVAATVDAKNDYLKNHSKRVAIYSREIARRMGFSDAECQTVYFAGLLHDIGKIGVSNRILDKAGTLTDEEYAAVKQHCVMGGEILKNLTVLPELAQVARWHHERYDGTGYPDGLKGEEILPLARIISVCDAYDAMSSERSYRCAMSKDEVLAELERCRGTQFDPQVLDVMLTVIADGAGKTE